MYMKLTKQDEKLLAYIYHNAREPISKIAKECKLSREQVNYKLKKFKKEGIIKKFITIFNYSSLGYDAFSILLIKARNNLNLKKMNNVISFSEIIGNYDYFITLIAKDEQNLKKIIKKILQENGESIEDYKLINPYYSEMYPLKPFKIKNSFKFSKKSKKQPLSKDEIKILKILEKNARTKIIEIAYKLNISAELALYKLKKLYKKEIIIGTKIHYNISKLGYNYSILLIDTKKFSEEIENKIKKFAREDNLSNSLILSINEPQIIIQFFYKTQEELNDSIKKIKNSLKNQIKNLEIMFPQQEKEINTFPLIE